MLLNMSVEATHAQIDVFLISCPKKFFFLTCYETVKYHSEKMARCAQMSDGQFILELLFLHTLTPTLYVANQSDL